MYFSQYKNWLLSIAAVVTLLLGSTIYYSAAFSSDSETMRFTDLSDADIDMILAVKAEMQLAKIEADY